MIFGGKKGRHKTLIGYTILICTGCGAHQKRKFVDGDVIFADAVDACSLCNGTVRIEQIFGDALE